MRRPLSMVCLLIVSIFFLFQQCRPYSFPDYSAWDGESVRIVGKISGKETKKTEEKVRVILYLEDIQENEITDVPEIFSMETMFNDKIRGVRCYFQYAEKESAQRDNTQELPPIGSYVLVQGTLSTYSQATNPGEFDSRMYYSTCGLDFDLYDCALLRQGTEASSFKEKMWRLGRKFADFIDSQLPENTAVILKAMLLGDKGELDAEIKELYKRNGIIHILSISGLHISILGVSLYKLLRKLYVPIVPAGLVSMLLMYSYGTMVGAGTSSLRAIIMFFFHIFANMVGRTYDMLTALAVAAVVLLWEQPLYLNNSGYLLSFGAVLAIGWYTSVIKNVPIAIFLITFPIHLWFYFEYPYLSFLWNLVVIPLTEIFLICGILLLAAGFLCPFLLFLLKIPLIMICFLLEKICLLGDAISVGRDIIGRPEPWQIGIYYTILVLLYFWMKRKRGEMPEAGKWLFISVSLLFLTCRWSEETKVVFLDVGQGDCIYLESAQGTHYLFDGGSTSKDLVGKYQMVPFLKSEGVKRLDYVFVSHGDADHYNGILEMLENQQEYGIQIGSLILPDIKNVMGEEGFLKLGEAAREAGVPISFIGKGMTLQENSLSIRCLHPQSGYDAQSSNEASQVFLIEQEGFRMLLTGDVCDRGEALAMEELQQLTASNEGEESGRNDFFVWKVAHHGSRYSTSEEVLMRFQPEIAIISCGAENSYGHPHTETLQKLSRVGSMILTTPDFGAITVEVGTKIKVRGWKSRAQ